MKEEGRTESKAQDIGTDKPSQAPPEHQGRTESTRNVPTHSTGLQQDGEQSTST